MSFLERFAKLKSDYKLSGDKLQVGVIDDELGTTEPIMWLIADITTIKSAVGSVDLSEEEAEDLIYGYGYEPEDKVLEVGIVNVKDDLYFKIPDKKRNVIATVLFKKFLEVYNQNWGKNSSYWMPVRADFANYELQEKFRRAVDEKQIFPEISMLLCGEVSPEEWKSSYYNMNNRTSFNDQYPKLIEALNNSGVTVDESGLVTNVPFNTFEQTFLKAMEDTIDPTYVKSMSDLFIKPHVDNGDITYYLPLKTINSFTSDQVDFYVNMSEYSATVYRKDNYQKLLDAEQNIRYVFAGYTISASYKRDMNVDEFIQFLQERVQGQGQSIAKLKIKRLIKKNSPE